MTRIKRKLKRYRVTDAHGAVYVTFGKSIMGVRARAKLRNIEAVRVEEYPGRWGLGATLSDDLSSMWEGA